MSRDGERSGRRRLEPAAPGSKVTPLELFYDLVFVFAFLNVTATNAKYLTPTALVKSLLILALLWFAWTTFVALGNVVRVDQGVMPLVGFATMIVVFVLAVTIPDAFSDAPHGLPGDLVFATCYFLLRALQVLALWHAVRGDRQLRRRWSGLVAPALISTALLLVAALVPQRLFTGTAEFGARAGLWLLAIAVEYTVSAVVRTEDLTIVSAGHWAERHAQIVLIALGESVISLGTASNLAVGWPPTWPIILASALGIVLISALWWVYFDVRAIAAEHMLHSARGRTRAALARDAYTYLHLPMIAGIILFALGLKRVLTNIAEPTVPSFEDALSGAEVYVLYGGVILYLLGVQGFERRAVRRSDWFQVARIVLLTALIPVADRLSAIAALTLLVLVATALIVAQSIRTRQLRRRVRTSRLAEQRELEAEETTWRRRHR
ncbi:low temperature requirement protein A [Micromonospora sp. NPDC052213]|uniref:low temperature requirement protein A n=1 Tax=Micromonospora sp. NPDC052213 TaxID=3155812 RepID=UPI003441EC02